MKRGASRMREQGYKQCILWLSPKEWERMDAASRMEGKPMATFIRDNANELAQMMIDNETAEAAKRRARPLIDTLLSESD